MQAGACLAFTRSLVQTFTSTRMSCLCDALDVSCVVSQDGNTPLHLAAKQGTAKIVRVLLTAHSDAGSQNKVGCGPVTF